MKTFMCILLMFFFNEAKALVPMEALTFDFNIEPIGMGRGNEEKLFKGVDLLREVFSSEEFKKRIIKHKFNGHYSFAHNRGLSNRRIYKVLLKGIERLLPHENNAMDVEVELYSDYRSQVLGFTLPRSRRTLAGSCR